RGLWLACAMVLAMAALTVTVRRYKHTPMVLAAGLSNFMGSLVSIPFARGITSLSMSDILVFAAFGFLQVGMGLALFVLGSRLLSSAQATLVATLESPLMPFWVAGLSGSTGHPDHRRGSLGDGCGYRGHRWRPEPAEAICINR